MFSDQLPITLIFLLFFFVFGSVILHFIVTFINLNKAKIYIEKDSLYKRTKFKLEKLVISDIKSMRAIDVIVQDSSRVLLSFENYILLRPWGSVFPMSSVLGRPQIAIKLTNKENKSMIITEPLIKLRDTISILKKLPAQNNSIEVEDFVKKIFEEESYNIGLLISTQEGKSKVTSSILSRSISFIFAFVVGVVIVSLIIFFLRNLSGGY